MTSNRIKLVDREIVQRLKSVVPSMVADENADRAAFRALMPHLYVMRAKNQSFSTIAKILRQASVCLPLAMVSTFYWECLAEMEEECVRYAKNAGCLADQTD